MNKLTYNHHFYSKVWYKLALIFLPALLLLALEFSLLKTQSASAAGSRGYINEVAENDSIKDKTDIAIFNELTNYTGLSSNLDINNSTEAEDLTPTSWWPGDGNTNDAIDSHNGTAYGVTYPAGKINQAFEFDGVSQSVDIPGVGDFGSNPFTLSFWLYAKSSGSGIYLIGKSYPDAGLGWDVRLNSQSISVVGVNGWGVNITSDSVVTPNTWHHIAIAASDLTGNSVKLYIDGDLKGSCGRQTISSTTNPLRFGMTTGFGGYPFTGLLDEAKLFDRALDEDEIKGLTTAFVDADANGAATGLSWTDAYTNVQDALIKSPGYDIWVAEGVYYPDEGSGQTDNDPTSSFNMTSTVAIYGGFDPDSGVDDFSERDWQTYITVLSGDLDHNDSTDAHGVLTSTNGIAGSNAYHVVTASGSSITQTAVLDGFYITGGNASGSSPYNDGGGLWLSNYTQPTLRRLFVSGNKASSNGGGAYISTYSSPSLSNIAFTGNLSNDEGGGLSILNYSSPSLVNVLISGNRSAFQGGAMAHDHSFSTLVNVTLADNNAAYLMGGINNYAGIITMTNSIVWGNNSYQLWAAGGASYSISYSDIEGGYSGTGNINADPLFVDPLSYSAAPTSLGNYRLQNGSPAINVGDSSAITEILDLDNNPRKKGIVDMGTYEYSQSIVFYVDKDASGANNGSSWDDAFTQMQSALDVASAGDQIWVAAGIYTPTNASDQTATFNLASGVEIYGGFVGTETLLTERDWLSNYSVLSGDLDHNDSTDAHGVLTSTNGIAGSNAYHVVTASGSSITQTAVLDGFYITGGNASGSSPYNDGGGLYINNYASPTLSHLWVSGNYASLDGGGARIYLYANPSLSNVTFSGNHSVRDGGGLRITDSSQPSLINVLISGNKTNAFGAGISDAYSNISLVNVTIADNYAEQGYGGVWSFQSTVAFTNCIVWGNNSSQIESAGGSLSVNYSIIQGGSAGIGNIDADPLFVSPLSYTAAPTSLGNYRLKESSLAIDSGDSSALTEPFDLDGKDRIVDGDNNGSSVVDMGTYEWQRYLLTVNEVGNGSVVKDPNQTGYTTHDSVVVTATAASGWNFTGWSGDITSNTNPLQLSMENTTTLTATFTQKSYPLYINVVGEGEVAKDPDQSVYSSGSAMTLTATADTGWSFSGWSGDVISTTNPLELSIATTTTLTATFTHNSYPLNVNIVGEGEVNKNPSLSSYPHGTPVTLTATADTGWSFSGWSGDVISTTNPLELSIATTTTLTATFTQNSYPLNINIVGEGEVNKNPSLSNYPHGTPVTLTATADPGWSFVGWTGDITSSTNPLLTTITSSTTLTATFSQNAYPLTIDIVGEGSVTKAPNLSNYPYGTVVTLTATADPAWFFAGWSGDVNSNQNPLVTTVTSTTIITATFDTYSAFLPTTIR